MKTILCYGDSNTWGYIPKIGQRYEPDVRWTGVLAAHLGKDYRVVEEGLNGRTTVFDDPHDDFRNGKSTLGMCVISQKPLDWVVLMLGTNDLKFADAVGAARGANVLVRMLTHADAAFAVSAPIFPNGANILLVSPILFHEDFDNSPFRSVFRYTYEESLKFAKEFKAVADLQGVHFLDAAKYASPSPVDGLHMEADSHQKLGEAIAAYILAHDGTK